jgi:hypothetical protein
MQGKKINKIVEIKVQFLFMIYILLLLLPYFFY